MTASRSTGTQTGAGFGTVKRARTDAQDGALEAGSGLQVTMPPRQIPHLYNNNYTVKLTYADNFLHTVKCDAAASVIQMFRSNSIWDPDYSGGGHQPLIRDTWASMYDYYTVLSCDYTIRLYNAAWEGVTHTTAGTQGQRIQALNVSFNRSTYANDYLTNGTVYPQAEMKNTSTYFLTPDNTIEIRGTVTPGDFIVDAKDADADTAWTAVGSNPAINRYIGYVLTTALPSQPAGVNENVYCDVQAQVILHYTVQFTQVNQLLRGTPS